jgi:hypothetical protein
VPEKRQSPAAAAGIAFANTGLEVQIDEDVNSWTHFRDNLINVPVAR